MNKKILVSLSVIVAVAAIAVGGTIAYFSDTETSTGNTFTAGAIDLTIDNESYAIDYTIPGYSNPTGALALSTATSWDLSDLTGKLFFNFVDLKPGDIGEDTISIHVNNNDAWMCMSTEITATPENGVTEPEGQVDNQDNGIFDGELQDALNFAFWVDDGDNVLEEDESAQVWQGTAEEFMNTSPRIIADSTFNIFGDQPGTPVPGDTEFYIAKAWCFGDLTLTPVGTDQGDNPTVATGITCDGSALDNLTQTDGIEGNISFYAEQARNNSNFKCVQPEIIQVDSSPLSFSSTGAGGWSCPTGHPTVVGYTLST
ncbi:MAG: TasA family protein, partial [Bacteroidota bacterium]